jgi:hypothetical protein
LPVEVEGVIKVRQLTVQPPETVEETGAQALRAHLLRECQSLLEHSQGIIIVALAREGDAIGEADVEEREQQVMFPSAAHSLREEEGRLSIITLPVFDGARYPNREALVGDSA